LAQLWQQATPEQWMHFIMASRAIKTVLDNQPERLPNLLMNNFLEEQEFFFGAHLKQVKDENKFKKSLDNVLISEIVLFLKKCNSYLTNLCIFKLTVLMNKGFIIFSYVTYFKTQLTF
jgi:hypothetical protein